ncbi:MAG: hypothetical protein IJM83_01655 [Firmicutes bacterium]|nr:hypothetical protein [Bacillota bacterium]
MPMPKNFTPEQIIAHLSAQTSPNAAEGFQGQAEQLNQFVQFLDQYAQQLGADSPELGAVEQLRKAGSDVLLNLHSLSRANDYMNPARMRETMNRTLTRYGQFENLYQNFIEQYPQTAQNETFRSFDQNFGGATFSEGGNMLDTLDMSDKKYVPPVEPIDMRNMDLSYLNIPAPNAENFTAWYQAMDQKVTERLDRPAPDFMDPNISNAEITNNTIEKVGATFYRNAVESVLTNALSDLSDQELNSIFSQLKTDAGKNFVTPQYFLDKIHNRTLDTVIMPTNWGCPREKVIAVVTEAISKKPELLERVISSMNQIKLPTDPSYPLAKEVPDQAAQQKIQTLRTAWTDPEDQQLLDEAQSIMIRVANPVRQYMDTFAQNKNSSPDATMDKFLDKLGEKYTDQGMKSLDGGTYQNFLKPVVYNEERKEFSYVLNDYRPEIRPQTMSPQNVENLKNTSALLSDITLQTAEEAMQLFDSMAFEGTPYTTSSSTLAYKPRPEENGPYITHDSEEGAKMYGFWPLMQAKQEIFAALEAEDKQQLKAAVEKYRTEEIKADQIISLVHKEGLSKDPIFSANVNATRNDCANLPAKYMTDYAGHNKVNSLYNIYAPLKTFGITFQEFSRDPVSAFDKMSERYSAANDLDSHAENTGSSFAWAKKNYQSDYARVFDVYLVQFDRGVMGLAGMEPDPVKRDQFMAKVRLSQLNARYRQEREFTLNKALETIQLAATPADKEKRNLLYQHAALLPDTGENRFNLKKFVEKTVDDPNWQTSLSLENELTPEKIAQMDLNELASRPERILHQFDEAKIRFHAYEQDFSRNDFLLNTYGLYSRILQNAPENMRGTPGYQALQQTVNNLPNLITQPASKALAETCVRLSGIETPFNDLQTTKTELFASSQDTNEYTTMKESVAAVRNTVQQMRTLGQNPKVDLAALKAPGLAAQLDKAQEDTFQYIRLKMKNGTKTSFGNTSGRLRRDEALTTLTKLHELQDQLGLRTPAQKLYDDCRLALLQNRKNKTWMQQNAMKTVTKMIYAKQFIDAKIPANKQEVNFTEEKINEKVQRMMARQPIRAYVYLTDEGKLAQHALEGNDKFAEISKTYTDKLKAQYREVKTAEQAKSNKEKFKNVYAMDIACDRLGLKRTDDPAIASGNPQVKALAEEIKKDPEFQETMDRLIKKNDVNNLRNIHALDAPERDPLKRHPHYEEELLQVQFERKYAEKIASVAPVEEGNRDAQLSKIRKDANVNALIQEATAGKNKQEMKKLIQDLDQPDAAQTILQKLQQRLFPQVPAHPAPEHAPEQPNLQQNAPQQGGQPNDQNHPVNDQQNQVLGR